MTSAQTLAALVIFACCSLQDSDPSVASELVPAELTPGVRSSSAVAPVPANPATAATATLALMVGVRITAGPYASDRIEFEFAEAIPEFEVEVPEGLLSHCDSSRTIRLDGSTHVLVTFWNARSHDDQGGPTIDATQLRGRGGPITEARQVCDSNEEVAWAIGINGPKQFQVRSLSNPPRFVVDVQN